MENLKNLEEAVKDSLERNGALQSAKALLRAEIFNILNEHSVGKPEVSNENLLINNLIIEYLRYNNYNNAASVLTLESGQPETGFNRDFLRTELNVTENGYAMSTPLLYSLVEHFMKKKNQNNIT